MQYTITSNDAVSVQAASVEADKIFHRRLLANCPNKVLLDLIETLMRRTQRYELALLRTEPPVKHSGEQHGKIIKALREHDLSGAAERLRENLTSGKAAILDWLSSRQARNRKTP